METITLNNGSTLDMQPAGDAMPGNVSINILNLADGIITRREAMRRLGLLGLGTAAASALLARFASAPAGASGGARSAARRRPRVGNRDGHRDVVRVLRAGPLRGALPPHVWRSAVVDAAPG